MRLGVLVYMNRKLTYQTEWKDVRFLHDYFVPHSAPGSKGLRVLVRDVDGDLGFERRLFGYY
jgi:hypothetical protein